MLFWILWVLCWLPLHIFFPLKKVGKKNVPKKGGVVLACNHYSNWDVELLQISFGRRFSYLAKKELMKGKFVNWFLKKLGAFPVDRDAGGDIAATKFALGTLKKGGALCLFPEGTRNKTTSDELQALKSGSIVFSAKTGTPLVPMMFLKRPKMFHRNVLVIGEPLDFKFENPTRPSKEEIAVATEKLSEAMKELQQNGLEKYFSQHKEKEEKSE